MHGQPQAKYEAVAVTVWARWQGGFGARKNNAFKVPLKRDKK